MTEAAMIAALYAVLCIIFKPISFSVIQIRIAEMFTVLPYFTFSAVPGVTLGCLLGNILTGADILDIVWGTVATLIGAIGSYLLKKHRLLVPLPPIISNTVIIPLVLKYTYGEAQPLPFLMLTVGIGEFASCALLGLALIFVLNRHRNTLFRTD